jgi:flavin-dependent dehydrogenase
VSQGALARAGKLLDRHQPEAHPRHWFRRRGTLAAPHILLAGDAAGTDSLVGEGISFALGYGEVAAAARRDAFVEGDFSFAAYRRRIMAHQIGRSMSRRAVGAALLCGLQSRRLPWFLWPLIGRAADRFLVDWDWGAE